MFPRAFNPYDSLGEAYLKAGNRDLAVKNYQQSLELNPHNKNAAEKLKTIQ
jgi:cytochrome c-type biogenesis protein CcmH/NrfG